MDSTVECSAKQASTWAGGQPCQVRCQAGKHVGSWTGSSRRCCSLSAPHQRPHALATDPPDQRACLQVPPSYGRWAPCLLRLRTRLRSTGRQQQLIRALAEGAELRKDVFCPDAC